MTSHSSSSPGERVEISKAFVNHWYISTACMHELHHRCRIYCTFCRAPCNCECHADRADRAARIDPTSKTGETHG